jgi:predicted dehydrogenase
VGVAKKTLKVALVGVGAAAQINHLPSLLRLEDVELVALCDRDPEKASRVAQKFGIPASYNRFEELLADDAIDAVDITTPNYLHAPMAVAALEAGKHVLCERPLARSGAEAATMAKAAKASDRLLMCAVQHRFRPDAQLLRKFVDKGDLGEIFLAKGGWLRQKTEWDSDAWRAQKRESGGGVVLDLGFQMLDMALWVLGDPKVESVTASVHRTKKGDVEDSATAFLRLASGATLTLELTWGLLMEKGLRLPEPVRLGRCGAPEPVPCAQGHARHARERDPRSWRRRATSTGSPWTHRSATSPTRCAAPRTRWGSRPRSFR